MLCTTSLELLFLELPEDKGGIDSAKAKGVGDSYIYLCLSGYVRDIVQVAFGVWCIIIYGRRYDTVPDGKNGENSFYSASRS